MIYHSDPFLELHQGDVLDVLRTLPSESVHAAMTSPPFFGLRQYLFDGAVMLRRDLDDATRERVEKELERRGIRPR